MTKDYRKILQEYQEKQLDEADYEEVAEEIAKVAAIQDYLFEQEEDCLNPLMVESEGLSEARDIQRKVRGKIRKQSAIIVLVVVILLLLLGFLLPSIMNHFFYNPLTKLADTSISEYKLAKIVENNLSASGHSLLDLQLRKSGWADYQLILEKHDRFKNQYLSENFQIKRGVEFSANSKPNELALFGYRVVGTKEIGPGHKQNTIYLEQVAEVESLPASAWVKTELFFNEAVSIATALDLLTDYPTIEPLAAHVKTQTSEVFGMGGIGFNFSKSLQQLSSSEVAKVEQLYPELLQKHSLNYASNPTAMEQHLLSSLQFLTDFYQKNKKSLKRPQAKEQQASVLAAKTYVEQYGIKLESITVALKPQTFKKITQDKRIAFVGVQDAVLYNYFLDHRISAQ